WGDASGGRGTFGGAGRRGEGHDCGLVAVGPGGVPDGPVRRFGMTGVNIALSVRSAAARMAARAAAMSASSLARKVSSGPLTALKVILPANTALNSSRPTMASTPAS